MKYEALLNKKHTHTSEAHLEANTQAHTQMWRSVAYIVLTNIKPKRLYHGLGLGLGLLH